MADPLFGRQAGAPRQEEPHALWHSGALFPCVQALSPRNPRVAVSIGLQAFYGTDCSRRPPARMVPSVRISICSNRYRCALRPIGLSSSLWPSVLHLHLDEPGRFVVFVDPAILVLTPEAMGANWVVLCQDEVYVQDRIAPEHLIRSPCTVRMPSP